MHHESKVKSTLHCKREVQRVLNPACEAVILPTKLRLFSSPTAMQEQRRGEGEEAPSARKWKDEKAAGVARDAHYEH